MERRQTETQQIGLVVGHAKGVPASLAEDAIRAIFRSLSSERAETPNIDNLIRHLLTANGPKSMVSLNREILDWARAQIDSFRPDDARFYRPGQTMISISTIANIQSRIADIVVTAGDLRMIEEQRAWLALLEHYVDRGSPNRAFWNIDWEYNLGVARLQMKRAERMARDGAAAPRQDQDAFSVDLRQWEGAEPYLEAERTEIEQRLRFQRYHRPEPKPVFAWETVPGLGAVARPSETQPGACQSVEIKALSGQLQWGLVTASLAGEAYAFDEHLSSALKDLAADVLSLPATEEIAGVRATLLPPANTVEIYQDRVIEHVDLLVGWLDQTKDVASAARFVQALMDVAVSIDATEPIQRRIGLAFICSLPTLLEDGTKHLNAIAFALRSLPGMPADTLEWAIRLVVHTLQVHDGKDAAKHLSQELERVLISGGTPSLDRLNDEMIAWLMPRIVVVSRPPFPSANDNTNALIGNVVSALEHVVVHNGDLRLLPIWRTLFELWYAREVKLRHLSPWDREALETRKAKLDDFVSRAAHARGAPPQDPASVRVQRDLWIWPWETEQAPEE